MDDEREKQFHRRSNFLIGLFALCLLAFGVILYDAQVVNYEAHLSRSVTQVTTTKTVEASRGIITDRNGKVLVSNKESYTISLDLDLISSVEGEDRSVTVSRAILRLLELCREQGAVWNDNLPISTQPPFAYTLAQASSTQRGRLQKYLHKRKWSTSELTEESPYPDISAEELMKLLREDLDVDPALSLRDARLVTGVLYELKLRELDPEYYVPPYIFAEDVSVELISILGDGGFQGVVIGSESVRQYNTSRAAHLLGITGAIDTKEERAELNAPYTAAKEAGEDTSLFHYYRNDDIIGKSGAERAFESYLQGREGKRVITTNEEGKITSELYSQKPQPGGAVALTLDIDLQAQVEDYLAQAIEAMNAEDGSETRGGAAVVVSVKDSDVLAMASYPTYDPAAYRQIAGELGQDPATPLINRATNSTYAPGSTFKPCTAVAALETGIIDAATRITTTGKYRFYNDYQPGCWIYNQYGGSHGRINVSEAIYHSCNYFFYEVGRLMGIETLDEYAAGFGLGQPTGIELGERVGILDGPEYRAANDDIFTGGDTLQCAIGQGKHLFTPLQLANYIATLVRGGQRYDAHILETVTTYDGAKTLYTAQPETVATVPMSETTLAAVKKGMGDLTTTGSVSRYFKDCIVSAGAKTGSAQIGTEVANGVFVCFAPFDQPEIAVAIVIEQGGSGSALAETAVNILNAYFAPSDIETALVPEGGLLP